MFRPGYVTPFPPTASYDLEMGGSAEKVILLDEEEHKENSPPTIPVSERPTRTPALLRSCLFGTRIENFPDHVDRNLSQNELVCMCFNISYN